MIDTSVKWFLSSQSITPPLSAAPGALLSVLRAALVTGMGATNVQSLVVASGVATATYATEHGYLDRQVVLIAGANEAPLNGEHRVTVTGTHTLTFGTSQPDGTATGSITSKLAPAGWLEAFTGTDVAVFQSQHEDATGCMLRVDDTGTTTARVVGYKTMTNVDTGSGAFPSEAQQAGGLYWPKAHNTTGNRKWAVRADEKSLLFYVQPTTGNEGGSIVGFGDLDEEYHDPWRAFLSGHASALFTGGAGCLSVTGSAPSVTLCMPSSPSGTSGAEQAYLTSALRSSGASGSPSGSLHSTFPDPAQGGLLLSRPSVISESGYRGPIPGLLHTPQGVVGLLRSMETEEFPGLMTLYTNSAAAVAFLELEA